MNKQYKNITLTILGGDDRMTHLATLLCKKGLSVKHNPCTDGDIGQIDSNYLVLPLPLTTDGVHLNCTAECKPELVDIINMLSSDTMVLGGCVSERVRDVLEQKGIKWRDYYQDEKLLQDNAALTAEATLQIVMQNLKNSVKSSRVLVIGSGRCGKAAAKLFKKIGAAVTLTSRKAKERIKTKLMGIKSAKTQGLMELVKKYDVIINTAPHPVLTHQVLQNIPHETLVIELASSAAGVDLQAAEELGTNLIYAPSLPGRYLPYSAAEAICNTVTKLIKEDFH